MSPSTTLRNETLPAGSKDWKSPSVSLRKILESDIHLSHTKGKRKESTAQLKKSIKPWENTHGQL